MLFMKKYIKLIFCKLCSLVNYRIYEDLSIRLADDVQTRAKATITTKPPLVPEEMSITGELEEGWILYTFPFL